MELTGTKTALCAGLTASFLATGGTAPYAYSVIAGGAGGSIDSTTGLYTAPSILSTDVKKIYDTIQAQDSTGQVVSAQILVGTPLLLFCEILQRELELENGRVYLWDQKIMQPTDSGLFIAVSVPSCKPFANNVGPALVNGELDWSIVEQRVNLLATLDIDIISRGPAARDRKEEIILALGSIYSEAQQEANSFSIGRLPPGGRFVNLSMIDGAAIPYRYRISVNMQYGVTKSKAVPYFDTFEDVPITTNP